MNTFKPDETVCHCFGHTVQDILDDARTHGRSTIAETVAAAKGEGFCRCAEKNPSGR